VAAGADLPVREVRGEWEIVSCVIGCPRFVSVGELDELRLAADGRKIPPTCNVRVNLAIALCAERSEAHFLMEQGWKLSEPNEMSGLV